MVRSHHRGDRIRESNLLQDLAASKGVGPHLLELGGSQAARFGDNMLRHPELADIAQHGRCAQCPQLSVLESQCAANLDGVGFHAADLVK